MSASALPIFPSGIDQINAGKCPIGARNPIACVLCNYGHMTECHHPDDCRTANCSHYQQQRANERYLDPEECA